MKRNTVVVLILLSTSLLMQSCGRSEAEIREEIQAEANQTATQEAVLAAQTAVVVTQAALSTTQTAMAAPPETTSTNASCPVYVYQDWGAEANHFVPEGWMGDIGDINFDENFKLDTNRPNVIKITYTPRGSQGFAGIYWWLPGTNWGNGDDVGLDISCASKVTFWARGENGGEKAEFKLGGIKGIYSDSLQPALSSGPITLTNEWVQYTIDLRGKDLTHIMGGFVWVINGPSNPNGATIYLDDIDFEQ